LTAVGPVAAGVARWQAAAGRGESAFQLELAEFFGALLPRRAEQEFEWGQGSDAVALFDEKSTSAEAAEVASARAWQRTLFDAGLGWPSGPVAYGGADLGRDFDDLLRTVLGKFNEPPRDCLGIGTTMVGPTIEKYGTTIAKQKYLAAIYRGDCVACELFSEPSAGSDLANVRTSAVRDGSRWILNGQKVWTSGAHYSDVGQVICRTDPQAPKHAGLTVFLVDMNAPGVAVRPLRQLTGATLFNEVFLDDVAIDDEFRLGPIDDGWTVTRTTLMFERLSIGSGQGRAKTDVFRMDRLIQLLRRQGLDADPVLRQQLADLYVHVEAARLAALRWAHNVAVGAVPGPELAASKLALSDNYERLAGLVTAVLGNRITADTGEWGTYAWSKFVLSSAGFRIAGGTDEIVRTIIGERVLGLPREPA
jgi:alkylation response protein AidB-like acyl-CoA dehydrogenase